MEAFGDAVVAGEAPHPDDLLGPLGEGLGEGAGALQAAGLEGVDQTEQFPDMAATGGLGLVLKREQPAELFLEGIDALQGRIRGEESCQALALERIEPIGAGAQQPRAA